MQRLFSFVAGAFCGAVVASVAVLLLTPVSGQELQSRGRAEADTLVAEVHRAYDDKLAELKAQLEALKAPKLVE
jgi:gas vesicle protein